MFLKISSNHQLTFIHSSKILPLQATVQSSGMAEQNLGFTRTIGGISSVEISGHDSATVTTTNRNMSENLAEITTGYVAESSRGADGDNAQFPIPFSSDSDNRGIPHHQNFTHHVSGLEGFERTNLGSEDSLDNDVFAPLQEERQKFLDQLSDVTPDNLPNETTCYICMDEFGSMEDAEPPVKLPCGHVIGRNCFSRWSKRNNSCPLCRRVVLEQGNPYQPVPAEDRLGFMEEYLAIREQQALLNARLSLLESSNSRLNSFRRRREALEIEHENELIQLRIRDLSVRYPNLAGVVGGQI